ncbi:MAG: nitrate reductase [Pseudomonadota bacterium]
MSRLLNPLAPRRGGIQSRLHDIKAWVRDAMPPGTEATVSVTELACRDEGCPDIETVIGILEQGRPIRTYRVHQPITDVTRDDVKTVLMEDAKGPGPRADASGT